MSERPEKKAIIGEIRQRLADGEFLILADCRGLNVERMTELRGQLDDAQSRLVVSKNWPKLSTRSGVTKKITGPRRQRRDRSLLVSLEHLVSTSVVMLVRRRKNPTSFSCSIL